jgi:hypothetical protein
MRLELNVAYAADIEFVVYLRLETERVRLGYEENFIDTLQVRTVEMTAITWVVVVEFLRLFPCWKRLDTVASVGESEEAAVSEELSPPLTESPNAGYRILDTNKSQTRQA